MSTEAPKSEILIGHCDYGRSKGEAVKIDLEAIAKHVLACGTTGSGKSSEGVRGVAVSPGDSRGGRRRHG